MSTGKNKTRGAYSVLSVGVRGASIGFAVPLWKSGSRGASFKCQVTTQHNTTDKLLISEALIELLQRSL